MERSAFCFKNYYGVGAPLRPGAMGAPQYVVAIFYCFSAAHDTALLLWMSPMNVGVGWEDIMDKFSDVDSPLILLFDCSPMGVPIYCFGEMRRPTVPGDDMIV